jgi:hypothetical protein
MERENLCFVRSEDVKGQAASGSNREGESTEARRRGGAARSSVEGPVMGLEDFVTVTGVRLEGA